MNKKIKTAVIISILLSILFLLYFGNVFTDKSIIYSTDYAPSSVQEMYKDHIPLFQNSWLYNYKLGANGVYSAANVMYVVHNMFSKMFARNFNLIISFFLFFITFYILFRSMKFGALVSIAGSAMISFSPSLMSYVLTGHVGKMVSMALFPLVIYFINKSTENKKNMFSLVMAGLTIGFIFLQGAVQTALYLSILATFYYFFKITDNSILDYISGSFWSKKWKQIILFTVIPIMAILLSFGTLKSYMGIADSTISVPTEDFSEENGWDWATQWSFPPEETIDFFMPGIFGYKSGSPDGLYWGRIGRDAHWQPGNGRMQNLCLNSNYLGIFMVVFALLALVFVRKRDVRFWAIALVVSLLLSYGKFVPLYSLFYKLPLMDKFRNPNKFMHVVHICMGMLSIYGFGFFIDLLFNKIKLSDLSIKRRKAFKILFVSFFSLTAIFALLIVLGIVDFGVILQKLNTGGLAPIRIMKQISSSALRFIFAGAVVVALLLYVFRKGIRQNRDLSLLVWLFVVIVGVIVFSGWYLPWFITLLIIASLLVTYFSLRNSDTIDGGNRVNIFLVCLITFFIIFDQAYVNKKYISFVKKDAIKEYSVLAKLKELSDSHRGRVKFIPAGVGFDSYPITRYDLENIDMFSKRSPDPDLDTFNRRMARNFLRQQSLLSVRYLVFYDAYYNSLMARAVKTPPQINQQEYQRLIQLDSMKKVLNAYCKSVAMVDGFNIYENTNAVERVTIFQDYEIQTNLDNIFDAFNDASYLKSGRVMLHSTNFDHNSFPLKKPEVLSVAKITEYNNLKVVIDVDASEKGLLKLADYYNGGWRATVDGNPVDIMRVDYLFRGVFVDKGKHIVEFNFASAVGERFFYFSLLILYVVLLFVHFFKNLSFKISFEDISESEESEP